MKLYIFRNFTIEHLFEKGTQFSGYDEFTNIPSDLNYLMWFYLLPVNDLHKQTLDLVQNYLERIRYVLSNSHEEQILLIFTLSKRLTKIEFESSDTSIREAVEFFNREIYSISKQNNRVKLIDIDDFYNDYSCSEIIDWKYYYLSKMILAPNLAIKFKNWFNKKLSTIDCYSRKKCLVLDLDNTLWGGVLGEDGVDGVKLGGDYPGNAFKDFQVLIKSAADTGVILAICSKNNISDVREIWEKHPEIVLKEENFASIKSNWVDKALNIEEIAKELNIGLDSMVFLDDNPRERERVIAELPSVIVPDFPEEPYELISFFNKLYSEHFQIYKLTNEDSRKSEQYHENAKRNQSISSHATIDDFIRNLEIELSFFVNKNIPRIAQMTQKTNQFNLTTSRYSESDLKQFIKNSHLIFSLGVKDKFGDSGVTAASIVKVSKENKTAEIDTFLLSCRIIGKQIEKVFLQLILNYLYEIGITTIISKYIASLKNAQTKDFFDNNSFIPLNSSDIEKTYKHIITEKLKIDTSYKINKL